MSPHSAQKSDSSPSTTPLPPKSAEELTDSLLVGPSAPSLPAAYAAPQETAAEDEEHTQTNAHNQTNVDVCLVIRSGNQLQRQRVQVVIQSNRELGYSRAHR